MPKAPGSGSLWTKIKSIKDFKETYIEHIASKIEKALEIKAKNLDIDNANLSAGAANFYVAEWKRLEKEFRNTEPQDIAKQKSAYEKHKKQLEKEKKAGITNITGNGLIKTTYDPEEDTGTDDR